MPSELGTAGNRQPRVVHKERMEKNSVVSQKDEWGCGIACVASITGLSYEEAKVRLEAHNGKPIQWNREGLELEPIVKVLADAGIEMVQREGQRHWPTGTIAFLSEEWGRFEGSGHYLVKTDDGWMDPWINIPVKENREGGIRKRLPTNTGIQVALVPVAALSSGN